MSKYANLFAALLWVLVLGGCAADSLHTPTLQSLEEILDDVLSGEATKASTPTAASEPTAYPVPYDPLYLRPEYLPDNLVVWQLFDPRDHNKPELFIPSGDGYRLDPDWQIETIAYYYSYWGMRFMGEDRQDIQYRAGEYYNQETLIPSEKIAAFVSSLKYLYPSQYILNYNPMSDNDPYWDLKITGERGEKFILRAFSTLNRGAGPWNVYYNGRIYTQYSGDVGLTVADLFPSKIFRYLAEWPEDITVNYETVGWPEELFYGVKDLDPFYDSVRFAGDKDQSTIRGIFSETSLRKKDGGQLTSIKRVEMSVGGNEITCKVTFSLENELEEIWGFSCPVPRKYALGVYSYPINISYYTAEPPSPRKSSGKLNGVWGLDSQALFVLPPPEELQQALENSPVTRDLLSDHAFLRALYGGYIDNPYMNPSQGIMSGDALLLGETTYQGQIVRYTIRTLFEFEDGAFTRWDLDRSDLEGMLAIIMNSDVFKEVIEKDPDTIIDLWYAEDYQIGLNSICESDGSSGDTLNSVTSSQFFSLENEQHDFGPEEIFFGYGGNIQRMIERGYWPEFLYRPEYAIVDGDICRLEYDY